MDSATTSVVAPSATDAPSPDFDMVDVNDPAELIRQVAQTEQENAHLRETVRLMQLMFLNR